MIGCHIAILVALIFVLATLHVVAYLSRRDIIIVAVQIVTPTKLMSQQSNKSNELMRLMRQQADKVNEPMRLPTVQTRPKPMALMRPKPTRLRVMRLMMLRKSFWPM